MLQGATVFHLQAQPSICRPSRWNKSKLFLKHPLRSVQLEVQLGSGKAPKGEAEAVLQNSVTCNTGFRR